MNLHEKIDDLFLSGTISYEYHKYNDFINSDLVKKEFSEDHYKEAFLLAKKEEKEYFFFEVSEKGMGSIVDNIKYSSLSVPDNFKELILDELSKFFDTHNVTSYETVYKDGLVFTITEELTKEEVSEKKIIKMLRERFDNLRVVLNLISGIEKNEKILSILEKEGYTLTKENGEDGST